MDIQRQIEYWKEGAISDLESVEILIQNKKILNGLFFCHLVLEKSLKAHYVKVFEQIPPRTHNLIWLCDQIKIKIEVADKEFLGILSKYQLEGRYPGYDPILPSHEKILLYLESTKKITTWLINQL